MLELSNRLSSAAAGGDSGMTGEASSPPAAGVLSRFLHRRLTSAPASPVYNEASGQRPAASGQRPAASGQRPAARIASGIPG